MMLRMRHRGVAYATRCRICNIVLHMRHLSVAYATLCRVCNTFSQKNDFSEKEPDEIFFNDWILIPACEDYRQMSRFHNKQEGRTFYQSTLAQASDISLYADLMVQRHS